MNAVRRVLESANSGVSISKRYSGSSSDSDFESIPRTATEEEMARTEDKTMNRRLRNLSGDTLLRTYFWEDAELFSDAEDRSDDVNTVVDHQNSDSDSELKFSSSRQIPPDETLAAIRRLWSAFNAESESGGQQVHGALGLGSSESTENPQRLLAQRPVTLLHDSTLPVKVVQHPTSWVEKSCGCMDCNTAVSCHDCFRCLDSPGRIFVFSLHYSLMTLTSVGYGDLTATYSGERAVGCLLMFCAGIIWASILGSACSILANMDHQNREFYQTMDDLNYMMRAKNLPNEFRVGLIFFSVCFRFNFEIKP